VIFLKLKVSVIKGQLAAKRNYAPFKSL